ncbi:hypothetical protein ACJROX_20190 [Pseudalkalibacillus sp. A8]|uniref:hypothetical protein n=1 Tax=Pseudalkalibacillus sp. A8 TaxID=3382641 RepID=UPI0038B4914F
MFQYDSYFYVEAGKLRLSRDSMNGRRMDDTSRKGEKAIKILGPLIRKKKDKEDDDKEKKEFSGFRYVNIFVAVKRMEKIFPIPPLKCWKMGEKPKKKPSSRKDPRSN